MSYNSLVVGALIEQREFFTEVSIGVRCERGHTPSEGQAYCPQCGGQFRERKVDQLTALGKRFVERFKTKDPEWSSRRGSRAYGLEVSGFFHTVLDGDGEGTGLAVLGLHVSTESASDLYHKTLLYVPPEGIKETIEEVKLRLAELGLGDREVKVYWF